MRVYWSLLVILSVLLVSCSSILPSSFITREKPQTFDLRVTSDQTSSAATRTAEYNLSYVDGVLINGSYFSVFDDGETPRQIRRCTYDVSQLDWIPVGQGDCLLDVPETTEGVYTYIDEDKWKTECGPYTTCVTFEDS